MRAREGFGAVSLLVVAGFLWGLLGQSGSPGERDVLAGSAGPVEMGPPVVKIPAPGARVPASAGSRLDWGPEAALEAAVGMSLGPDLGLFLQGDGSRRLPLGVAATQAPPSGWVVASSVAAGQPVAEPPLWLVLSLAGGALWSRQRSAARIEHPGPAG